MTLVFLKIEVGCFVVWFDTADSKRLKKKEAKGFIEITVRQQNKSEQKPQTNEFSRIAQCFSVFSQTFWFSTIHRKRVSPSFEYVRFIGPGICYVFQNQNGCPENKFVDRLLLGQQHTDYSFEHSEMIEIGVKAFEWIYSFEIVAVGDCKANIRGKLEITSKSLSVPKESSEL